MAQQSKMFSIQNGTPIESIVGAVEGFMRAEKSMEVQSTKTTEGWVIQGSQHSDGWKTISGTRLAITVQLIEINEMLNVMVGEGQWSDKLGAGALGFLVAWPLAVTAVFGTIKQKKLPEEIFEVIEKCIMMAGVRVVISDGGAVVAAGKIVCPSCKVQCEEDSIFCCSCGAKLSNNCPKCGEDNPFGSKFCNKCGEQLFASV
jgi:hypothetical protein